MLVEMRIYRIKPTRMAEYLEIYAARGLELQREHLGRLLGVFYSEIGTLNQVVSLWAYDSLDDRLRRRAALGATLQWQEYVSAVRDLFDSQESSILNCAYFSPIK